MVFDGVVVTVLSLPPRVQLQPAAHVVLEMCGQRLHSCGTLAMPAVLALAVLDDSGWLVLRTSSSLLAAGRLSPDFLELVTPLLKRPFLC